MELAGLIVRALPRYLQSVKSALLSVPGLEIHHIDPDGRMIVTIELNSHKALSNSISLLQGLDKVLAVSLVYQHSEVLEDTNSEVSHDLSPQSTQHLTQQQTNRES
jgi:nitrate reductase NapD